MSGRRACVFISRRSNSMVLNHYRRNKNTLIFLRQPIQLADTGMCERSVLVPTSQSAVKTNRTDCMQTNSLVISVTWALPHPNPSGTFTFSTAAALSAASPRPLRCAPRPAGFTRQSLTHAQGGATAYLMLLRQPLG